jgi:hypothetical protein
MHSTDGIRGWARTTDGWAMNLDGSDGALVFSLPRLELRSSSRGWRSICFLADGSQREVAGGTADSLMAAKDSAVEQARGILGTVHAAALLGVPAR